MLFLQHLTGDSPLQPGQFDEMHVQLPLWHVRLLLHTCPHEPQLLLSVCSATQTPLQFVYVLLHWKEHALLVQVGDACATLVVHGVGAFQFPPAPQLSTPVPEHVVCPGAQLPEHIPPVQVVFTQAAGAVYVPSVWQVSVALPEHALVPGVHEPTQAPFWHAWLLHAAAFCQAPVLLHVWGC